MLTGELERTLTELEQAGRRPKFIYTIPNFHNPAGVTLSLERRHELVRIAAERELLVLEDNPYGLLRYEGDPLPTLYSLDSDFVVYTSTFSKILSPGVRLGWAVAPPPVLAKMNVGKQSTDLCSSSISQYFVGAYFQSGQWSDYVRSLIEIYRLRRDVMLDALAEHFPREAPGRTRRGACSSGRRCPTTSTPPTSSPGRCRSRSRSCPDAPPTSTAAAARRCD